MMILTGNRKLDVQKHSTKFIESLQMIRNSLPAPDIIRKHQKKKKKGAAMWCPYLCFPLATVHTQLQQKLDSLLTACNKLSD